MNLVLINPNANIEKSQGKYSIFGTAMPPMGVAYLATLLHLKGFKIYVIDQYVTKISNEQLLEEIKQRNPCLVGISCLTAAMTNVETIVSGIQKLQLNTKIVLGNIHATLFAEELLADNMADIIVRGEGEGSFLELAENITEGNGYFHIKGISYRNSAQVIHNPDREPVDLEENPFPLWELLPYEKYNSVPLLGVDNEVMLHIQASRGCPYKCFFCSQEAMHKKVRIRKVKNVVDEMELQSKKYNVNKFAFVDAYFPMTKEYGMTFAEEMIRRGLHKKIKWATETRVDKVDYELLKKLKEAGLNLIMYGFESGAQEILDGVNKGITIEQSKISMEYTRRLKIPSLGFFILGLPGENRDTIKKTIKFSQELDCDLVKFNIAIPTPGSKFFQDWRLKAGKENLVPEKFSSWYSPKKGEDIVYSPEGISSKEMESLRAKAMIGYYFRLKIILRSFLKRTISFQNICKGAFVLLSELLPICVQRMDLRR